VATKPKTRRVIRETSFWRAYNRSRYAILFYALLLTLIAMPIASTIGLPTTFVRILVSACLLSAVMPNAPKHMRVGLFVGVILLIVARFASESDAVPLDSGIMLAIVGFTGLAAAAGTLRFVVSTRAVDSETLYAALSTYLLAGIFFGQIYWSLDQFWPGSLVGPDPTSETTSTYYSFVTLATLGYGDYLPRTDIARGVATFEVIGGQLFLAVMVARLIGLFVPKKGA
jgi:hypothetical protein